MQDTPTNRTNADYANTFNRQRPNDPIKFSAIDCTKEKGVKILGIIFHPNPAQFQKLNFEPIVKKVETTLNMLTRRALSIQGKTLATNTFVFSKLWYTATTVPLTTHSLLPLHPMNPNFVKQIYELTNKFIWKSEKNPISRKILALPRNKGGLSLQLIAEKALALRSKQLNQALDSDNNTPAALLARFWLSNRTRDTLQWAHTLPTFDPPPPPNKGYNALFNLLYHNKKLYTPNSRTPPNPKSFPNSNKIYKEYVTPQRPASQEAWWNLGFPDIPWENSFKTLNPPKECSRMYKLRHLVLIAENAPPGPNPETCPLCPSRDPVKQSHIFSECSYANLVWGYIRPSLTKIAPLPRNPAHAIIGLPGTSKYIRLANTLIVSTINVIWLARCKAKFEGTSPPPRTTAKIAMANFKRTLKLRFEVYKSNNNVNDFKTKVIHPSVAEVLNGSLHFRPDFPTP